MKSISRWEYVMYALMHVFPKDSNYLATNLYKMPERILHDMTHPH